MPKDTALEPTRHETRTDKPNEKTRDHRSADDKPTECGLTREELRALVVEMIG
jgi:hypothetical protein